jgi:protein-S-isoprenylcysteine O-methyltransferase Ste14
MFFTFRIILALIFVAFIAHRAYYNHKYPPSAEDTIEVKESSPSTTIASFVVIAGLISLFLYLFKPNWISWASIPLPYHLRLIGVGIVATGFGLIQWSQYTLGRNWSDTPRITDHQELVMDGPYRWVRHPIYTAFVLIFVSTLFISANWFLSAAWIGMVVLDITSRVQYEEDKLTTLFGDQYRAYLDRTGRFLPRF